jgi:Pretoxin HINT domain
LKLWVGKSLLRARWYDPSVGRFINEDTYEGDIKDPLSLNLYTYVENNPLTKVDPSGNSAANLCMYSLEFNCFSAGTKVQTDEGLKPIEEIQVGDKVQTRDEETGETAYNLVEELIQRETDETYHVSVNGTTIVTTAEHPFWVSGEGWVEARDLKKGDMLVDLDENEVPIEESEIKKERTTVYNFRVQSVHNYFVTDLKIWTHNCGGSYGGMSGARLSSSSNGARVGGVGGGYSRPANVSRGTTGIRIEVTKKSADQFYKSVMDKAFKSKGTGNLIDSSPIKIPGNAVKVEQAKNGYDQIKYNWSDGTYKYEARWHTRTPGAPADQGNTWVVTRTTPGSQTTRKQQHILTGDNQWTSMKQWQDAVSARQNGVATPEQQALLGSGHWSAP